MSEAPEGPRRLRPDRRDGTALGLLLLLGGLLRAGFVYLQQLPPYDPWRHLELVRNLREGLGFTLFADQPYLWYSPVWYRIAALAPEALGLDVLAAVFSLLAVPPVYLLLRGEGGSRATAAAGGLLMAASGPVVAFTCHYGPEALALCLVLWAAVLALSCRSPLAAAAAGILFGLGLVLRLNFAFSVFLFLPLLRRPGRALALLGGSAVPLAATWWRNHSIIADHAWLFTWDGLATPGADFTPLSTLVVQMHPAVQEGLRRLHEIVVPAPEWLGSWGTLLFMLLGVVGVLLCRRADVTLTVVLTLGYFLLLDTTHSSNFFRIYLVVFPAFFLGLARASAMLRDSLRGLRGELPAWGLIALPLIGGASMLVPRPMLPLEMVTPPPDLLTADAYMVNSTFFHPESLIYRFPEKRFIGMPLDPARFEEFRRTFPQYRTVLWHDFSVQDELADYLTSSDYRVVARAVNDRGRRYTVLEPPPESADQVGR